MTICRNVSNSRPAPDGVYLVADILATELPDPMPLTGGGIQGMEDTERLDAGSHMLVLADGGSEYILGSDLTWYKQERGGDEPLPVDEGDPYYVYATMRPRDWLPMPDLAENEVWLLWHIAYGASASIGLVAYGANFDVDLFSLQDGSLVCFRSNHDLPQDSAYTIKNLSANSFDVNDESLTASGAKQVLIRVRPSTRGQNMTSFSISKEGTGLANIDSISVAESSINIPFHDPERAAPKISTSTTVFVRFDKSSSLTDISNMFYFAYNLLAVLDLPTENIINAYNAFAGCYKLKAVPRLDFRQANRLYGLFSGCGSLVKVNITGVAEGVNMSYSFASCSSLQDTQALIDMLAAHNVNIMQSTYQYCRQIRHVDSLVLAGNLSVDSIFGDNVSLLSIENIDALNYSAYNGLSKIFNGCYSLQKVRFATGRGPSVNISVYNCALGHDAIVNLFYDLMPITTNQTITITGNPGADGLTTNEIAIATGKGWTVTGAKNIIDSTMGDTVTSVPFPDP